MSEPQLMWMEGGPYDGCYISLLPMASASFVADIEVAPAHWEICTYLRTDRRTFTGLMIYEFDGPRKHRASWQTEGF